MKKLIQIIAIIHLLPALLSAQFGSELQQGARQQGLGEAFTGLADDGEAVYYNAAGLANLKYTEGITMYSRQLGHLTQGDQGTGINVSYLGLAHNFGERIGSFGIRHYYRGYQYGDVFSASEHLIMLGYGRHLSDLPDLFPSQKWLGVLRPLSLGFGAKFMKYGFYKADALVANPATAGKSDVDTWTWSMDFSAFYKFNEAWSAGFLFKDFNRPQSSMLEDASYLDKMDYTVGAAWKYGANGKDLISLDMMSENKNYGFNIGTEKVWDFQYKNGMDEFIVRTGGRVGFEEDYNWTMGAGYKLSNIGTRMDFGFDFDLRFDYSYKVLFGNISDGPGNHCWELVFMLPDETPKPIVQGPADRDKDGIIDLKDKCPDLREDFDGFKDEDGCPDSDNDQDGIADELDKCPNLAEDKDRFEDEDGCPDLDNDKDGLADTADKCPDEAEDPDGFEDTDGCPDTDNDQDGILDSADKCPLEAETVNGFQDEDGCPDVILKKDAKITLNNVYFETAKALLTPESSTELDKLGMLFADYPNLKVMVEGHTDNVGNAAVNKKLSMARAKAVVGYLISKFNISAAKLQYAGYGSEKPVSDNKTPDGRAKNRRIEFKVLSIE